MEDGSWLDERKRKILSHLLIAELCDKRYNSRKATTRIYLFEETLVHGLALSQIEMLSLSLINNIMRAIQGSFSGFESELIFVLL